MPQTLSTPMLALLAATAASAEPPPTATAEPITLITGASGRTGSLLYKSLKAKGQAVRGFVASADKARQYLNCTSCDESEGIYVGNVTDPAALLHAAQGVSACVICVGVSGTEDEALIRAVEFTGVQNTLAALAQPSNVKTFGLSGLRMVLLSSMGTTQPNPDPSEGGPILFFKLNAEAYIGASGVPFAIVKPCGLTQGKANSSTLLVGHDDTLLSTFPPLVSREDVARVLEATLSYDAPALRLDLCSKRGPPTTDVDALLDAAQYPWQ